MAVLRIVPNLLAAEPQAAKAFYQCLLGLDDVMDNGWIVTFAASSKTQTQLSVAREGGSGTEVPSLSVEVDNIDETYAIAQNEDFEITYRFTDEPWDVRRFYVRDPSGNLVNILAHPWPRMVEPICRSRRVT